MGPAKIGTLVFLHRLGQRIVFIRVHDPGVGGEKDRDLGRDHPAIVLVLNPGQFGEIHSLRVACRNGAGRDLDPGLGEGLDRAEDPARLEQRHGGVRNRHSAGDRTVLHQVDPGFDRLAQALDRGGVGLDRNPSPVAFLDDDPLLLGAEHQHLHAGMTADGVFEEVHLLRGIRPNRHPERVRRKPHELGAGAFFPGGIDPVDERLRRGSLRIAIEAAAERSGQSEDVAGHEEAGPRNVPLGDPIAGPEQGPQRAPGVEDGRQPVCERDLSRFRHELVEPALISGQEFDRDAVHQMDVGVHHPGNDVFSPGGNDRGPGGNFGGRGGADRYDAAIGHHDGRVGQRRERRMRIRQGRLSS